MEVTVKELTEVSREVEITATATELAPHFEKAYKDYRPKIEIRGFRKGKAPLDLVKKLYGEMIENESLETVAGDLYRQVAKEKDLKPIGEPRLVDMNFKRGEQLQCKVQYDVRPKIELKQYKHVAVEKVVHKVTSEEVEEEILRLRRVNSTMEEVTAVTDQEHVVTVTMQELDQSGAPLIGKKNENVRFYLADDQLEQPFKDALKAAQVNGEYRVKFEHQHGDHTHNVDALLKVRKVEKVALPELNDAFVAKITKDKIKSVVDFRRGIEADLVTYWKDREKRQVLNSITEAILKNHEFQVPESLVNSVLEGLLEEMKNEYPKKQLPANFDVNKFYEQNRAYAEAQAKWALLREEIIKKENLLAGDDDLTKLAEQEAGKIGIDKDRLVAYYKSSDQVKDRIVGTKLLDFLLESAKVKEVAEQHSKK
ncbi:MAG TPA: trigger factor [Bacteroidota bacterium]|nr:trigger factor [Bacteroidota bacterium]